jgi:hypothetical protein
MFRVSVSLYVQTSGCLSPCCPTTGNSLIASGIKATCRRYNREAMMSPVAPLLKDALPCPSLAPRSQCITFFDSGSPRCCWPSPKNAFPR